MSEPDSEQPQQPQPNRPQHLSARVPESVSRGVFSNAVVIISGPTEFILDFVQNLGHPAQVATRVIMPPATVPAFIQALQKNLELYVQRYGPIPELPRPSPDVPQPTLPEIYDELKLPDEMLSGAYSNGVIIGHSASEFKFDFLTQLFPHTAISSRVYLASPQVPRLLDSLQRNYQQFLQRSQQPPRPPGEPTG